MLRAGGGRKRSRPPKMFLSALLILQLAGTDPLFLILSSVALQIIVIELVCW